MEYVYQLTDVNPDGKTTLIAESKTIYPSAAAALAAGKARLADISDKHPNARIRATKANEAKDKVNILLNSIDIDNDCAYSYQADKTGLDIDEDWTYAALYAPANLIAALGLRADHSKLPKCDYDYINFTQLDTAKKIDGKRYLLIAAVGGAYSDVERQHTTWVYDNFVLDEDGEEVEIVGCQDKGAEGYCETIDERAGELLRHYNNLCLDTVTNDVADTFTDDDVEYLNDKGYTDVAELIAEALAAAQK
jgi:hypothetical protein